VLVRIFLSRLFGQKMASGVKKLSKFEFVMAFKSKILAYLTLINEPYLLKKTKNCSHKK